MVIWTKAN
jgi:hypothetical protein